MSAPVEISINLDPKCPHATELASILLADLALLLAWAAGRRPTPRLRRSRWTS